LRKQEKRPMGRLELLRQAWHSHRVSQIGRKAHYN
jgi:hypothetical protein